MKSDERDNFKNIRCDMIFVPDKHVRLKGSGKDMRKTEGQEAEGG
jgi:hypothetical protein